MNWLDIILIIIGIIVGIFGIVMVVWGAMEDDLGIGIGALVVCLIIAFFTSVMPFIIIDKSSGVTIGEITSVDKNFFGTTAIYLKVNEATQERGCIEDEKLSKKASELIGKKIKVTYGTRVGLYSTGKCNYAPIDSIELVK